jgi:signal transduction histidine kinase
MRHTAAAGLAACWRAAAAALLCIAALLLSWLPPAAAQADPAASAPPLRVVRYGLLAGYPPYQLWPEGSVAGGADLQILAELARAAGIRLDVVRYATYPQLEADLRAGRIQLASSMARTADRDADLLFTTPYTQAPLALLARADQPSAALLPDLAGRSIAVVPGHASQGEVDKLFPVAPRVVVPSSLDGVQAVQNGRADLMLDVLPVLTDMLAREQFQGLAIVRRLAAPSGRLHFALPRSEGELAAHLTRALAALPPGHVDAVIDRWTARPPAPRPATLVLSADERARLAAWPAPMVGVVGREPPFASSDADGQPEGLSVDVLKTVLARLGVQPRGWLALTAAEVPAALATGRVDLLVGADESALRQARLRFVGPFVEYPSVLVGRPEGGAFDLDQLRGRKLALPRLSAARPFVESRHPGVALVDCSGLEDCLATVQQGRADATLSDVVGAAVALSRRPRPELQIIGAEPQLRRFHSLALSDTHAALAPLFDRALAVTVGQDMLGLKARWFGRPSRAEVLRAAASRYGPWLAAALALLAGLGWWHTQRLRAEVQRTRVAQQAAEQAGQAKARFTTFLAHEVRNSLHAVVAGTELARMPGAAGSASMFSRVADSARSTLRLLNNLIDRDRLDAGRLVLHPEPTRVGPLLQSVVDEMAPAATYNGQALQALLPAQDPPRLLDALRLQQVLRNLVSNAIKHAGEGDIQVQLMPAPPGHPPDIVDIEVRDHGKIVDAQTLLLAFEPFSGGVQAENSAGLGLPISRRLARLMGGDLTLVPREGGGTVARLQVRAALASAAPAPAGRALQVLLVEDNEVFAMLVARAFEQGGHTVQLATSLAEGRVQLAARRFDVLLSDMQLPDGSGARFLRDIALAPGPRPALVAMTADRSEPPEAGVLPAGVALLEKTGDAHALVARVLLAAGAEPAAA